MANIENVRGILKKGVRFGAVARVNAKQIEEAAERVVNAGTATRDLLEQIGSDAIGDRLLFCGTDIELLNKALARKTKREDAVEGIE